MDTRGSSSNADRSAETARQQRESILEAIRALGPRLEEIAAGIKSLLSPRKGEGEGGPEGGSPSGESSGPGAAVGAFAGTGGGHNLLGMVSKFSPALARFFSEAQRSVSSIFGAVMGRGMFATPRTPFAGGKGFGGGGGGGGLNFAGGGDAPKFTFQNGLLAIDKAVLLIKNSAFATTTGGSKFPTGQAALGYTGRGLPRPGQTPFGPHPIPGLPLAASGGGAPGAAASAFNWAGVGLLASRIVTVASAVVDLGVAFRDLLRAAAAFAEGVNQSNRSLRAFSPALAHAFVKLDYQTYIRGMRMARATELTGAALAENIDRMREAWTGWDQFAQGMQNRAGSFNAGLVQSFGEVASGIGGLVNRLSNRLDPSGEMSNTSGWMLGRVIQDAVAALIPGGPALLAAVRAAQQPVGGQLVRDPAAQFLWNNALGPLNPPNRRHRRN